ncbi:MAG TPA: hypothetical protein VNB23_10845 [Ramlibacter sp.]|nr:hypothetical protein [Ramlibacter sp.]
MKAASPLSLLLAALVAVFALGVSLAVVGLLALRDPGAAIVLGVAAFAGLLAAVLAYLAARNSGLGPVEVAREEVPVAPVQAPRAAASMAALPVASLPAPYLEAVMKGLHANRQAFVHQRQPTDKQAGA